MVTIKIKVPSPGGYGLSVITQQRITGSYFQSTDNVQENYLLWPEVAKKC